MANTPYQNFVLENKVEDQFKSHLDLQQFCKIDRTLTGVAGMKKKVHVYAATDGTQKLTLGQGNTKSIEASYTEKEYDILLAQNRGVWHDEEQMTDPMIGLVIARHAATDMPLRYNYDKPEKPRISRVFGYLARFFILFQTEKSSREVVIS